MFQKIIYDLPFRLGVQTSDIEGDELEHLRVRSHIGELSVDMSCVSVGGCISFVFPAIGSIPSRILYFLLGLLPFWGHCFFFLLFFLFGCLDYCR
jgi:hypothetical protein